MRKKIIIILVVVAAALVYEFRFELLFSFQYARLKGLSCPTENEGVTRDSCLEKIWAHRVNSIERFKKIEDKFAGYETDITWDTRSKQFLVYHPPLEGSAISLDSFLNNVNTHTAFFWLDTRETTAKDSTAILAAFDKIDSQFQVKLSTILEIYDTTVANMLANHGYQVALNINTDWIHQFSRPSQWEKLRQSMSPRISYVSQEDVHIPTLKKYFPGKEIITWSISFDNYFNRSHLKQLMNDDQVKVILVNVKSRFYK